MILIFAGLVILIISCIACEDGSRGLSTGKTNVVETISGKSAKGHVPGEKECSPLCQCSCCSSPSYFPTLQSNNAQEYISFNYGEFVLLFNMQFTNTVWHPPTPILPALTWSLINLFSLF